MKFMLSYIDPTKSKLTSPLMSYPNTTALMNAGFAKTRGL
jgi:hypothetical protein